MTVSKGRSAATSTPAEGAAATTSVSAELEQPVQGGSYVRQPDGTLTRVEFTEEPLPEAPAADAPPAGDSEDKGA